ncbi:MAG: response regulator [Cyclobacteriaceae bacterium]|jgi:CheY-like chemotaxis protein|nr:response regulator [Cyclobacteriaceae bacterium]
MGKAVVICIIDDDDVYQYTVTRALKSDSLAKKILVFSDGEEALDFMIDNIASNDSLPDVIFLDINMPIMDGWQFLEEYVKLKPRVGKQITIYMVTSSVDPVDVDRAAKFSEISDYLVKPIQPDQIRELVAAMNSKE